MLVMLHDANAADPSDYLGKTGRHRLLAGDMPPGYLGQARLAGRGFVNGYFQPVALTGPQGTRFALTRNGGYSEGSELLQAGLLVGSVYRFQVTRIPMMEGAELYPTLEVIDRTYPPPGLATRYPIVINLDQEDLEAALAGKMVTRVIYLEDPETAIPMQQTPVTNRPVEVAEFQDALAVADRLGRPVAIVRIGSLAPPRTPALMPSFFFGFPAWAPIESVSQNASHPSLQVDMSVPPAAQRQPFPAPAENLEPAVTVTDQPIFK
jgi:hypothetical protein